jgi:hypothetical protein
MRATVRRSDSTSCSSWRARCCCWPAGGGGGGDIGCGVLSAVVLSLCVSLCLCHCLSIFICLPLALWLSGSLSLCIFSLASHALLFALLGYYLAFSRMLCLVCALQALRERPRKNFRHAQGRTCRAGACAQHSFVARCSAILASHSGCHSLFF